MIKKQYKIMDPIGIHARPAAKIAVVAKKFDKCSLTMIHHTTEVNLKSILSIISLGVSKGSIISIIANGHNEEQAITKINEILIQEKLVA